MTIKPLKQDATYDDLREVPDHFVAEMFDGDLYTFPRPALPHANASSALTADWFCEVLSASTEAIDRGMKLRIYACEGVAHAWLVDPLAHTLEAMSLEAGRWTQLGRYEGEEKVRAAPFDAIELDPGALWI